MNQASYHSMTFFLNSLIHEWDKHYIAPFSSHPEALVLPLQAEEKVFIPLKKRSPLQRHHYEDIIFYQNKTHLKEISFLEMVQKLGSFLAISEKEKISFEDRVKNSFDNMALALEKRSDEFLSSDYDFQRAEQALLLGHNLHPAPKSRGEFSLEDYHQYSPEMGGSFPLHWVLLSPDIFYEQVADNFSSRGWLFTLFANEEFRFDNHKVFVPFPLHPWQKTYLWKNPLIQDYLVQGKMIDLGVATKKWTPTSSLRTLYQEAQPYMLKFSLSLKMTNSLRHVPVHEALRGLQIYDVLATSKGKEFRKNYPQFQILGEPAFAAIKDKEGAPLIESMVICRENAFQEKKEAIVLATLTQESFTKDQSNLIQVFLKKRALQTKESLADLSRHWFERYLEIAVRPLLMAQAQYGLLLGAHQQNLVLELQDGFPIKAYFRDCHGAGFAPHGYELFASEVASIDTSNGNVLPNREGNFLFSYYLIINSTFSVISALAHNYMISEEELLIIMRNFLNELKEQHPYDLSCLDYLLASPTLMHKGNFFCSLRNINENTTDNPLSIYTPIPNPLVGLSC